MQHPSQLSQGVITVERKVLSVALLERERLQVGVWLDSAGVDHERGHAEKFWGTWSLLDVDPKIICGRQGFTARTVFRSIFIAQSPSKRTAFNAI